MVKDLKNQLEKSVRLSHLKMESADRGKLVNDLEKILDFVALIEKTQQEGVAKKGQKITLSEKEFPQTQKSNVMQEDRTKAFTDSKLIRDNFPGKNQNNLIKVKKI